MKINWKVRIKNPVWWAQMVLAVLTPILAYAGITTGDLTSWPILGKVLLGALENPYVLAMAAISAWGVITDPTTAGLGDSPRALTYKDPKDGLSDL